MAAPGRRPTPELGVRLPPRGTGSPGIGEAPWSLPRSEEGGAVAEREREDRGAAPRIAAVSELEEAPVRLGDLPAQKQPDARALGLRREEGDEEVIGLGQPRPLVLHRDLHVRA